MKRSGGERRRLPAGRGQRLPHVLLRGPAGSPCRTGEGRVAAQYHTARFRLVPSLAKTPNVPTPPARKPGSVWIELPRPAAAGTA
ncbi:zinc finger domain-containing protein, partial [Streptosporangium roseum]|uniref:zinc finger domain-containing protein n=1 Tax=Streptosporangium roseum TaxID=2001 RepID=UPI003D9E382E